MITYSPRALWSLFVLVSLALTVGMSRTSSAQTPSCGNAYYDDGSPVGVSYFSDCAGDPNCMMGVRFELVDFGYEPGHVEITGFCANNVIDSGEGARPGEVFIYPDDNGRPDDSVVLGHGTIHTGNGAGASIVMLDDPLILYGDFWLVNRGYAPFARSNIYMEGDIQSDGGHSYYSTGGIQGLVNQDPWGYDYGDWCLRAYLQPVERSYLTAGIAHTTGANDTQWRSKLAVLNPSEMPAEATLRYLYGSASATETIQLGPGELAAWDDVAVDLFGVAGESSGSIRVDADGPLEVTARTYHAGDEGTVGQTFPGVPIGEAMTSGQLGLLPLISNTAAFRTNVGFINLGSEQARVRVTLYDASRLMLGSKNILIEPGASKQQNDIFGAVGAGTVANGYATVEVLTLDANVWGYASVVDNATGDPTTVRLTIQ